VCANFFLTGSSAGQPQALTFEHSSYTDSQGNVYTGSNGFTVTDSYSCNLDTHADGCGGFTVADTYGTTTAGATTDHAGTTGLLQTITDTQGNVYSGNGFTVTDTYTCGHDGGCGGYTVTDHYGSTPGAVADHAGTTGLLQTITDTQGNVYTGNGFTVTDTYTCNLDTHADGCGGFSVVDNYGTTTASATTDHAGTTGLLQTITDTQGNVYSGNGFTVTDSYTCGHDGGCGGYTVTDHYGSTPGAVADHADTTGLQQLPTLNETTTTDIPLSQGFTVVDTYTCPSDCGSFTVIDPNAPAPQTALAAPVVDATPAKSAKPSPGSFIMCGHAMVLGAIEATITVGSKAAKGEDMEDGLVAMWQSAFKQVSGDAATTMNPLSGFALKQHVLA
jgi:predicted nucleic acid-binding Zn ribbon protein